MECPFKPGDVVHLRSGSSDMTVELVEKTDDGQWLATCVWNAAVGSGHSGEIRRDTFRAAALDIKRR